MQTPKVVLSTAIDMDMYKALIADKSEDDTLATHVRVILATHLARKAGKGQNPEAGEQNAPK